MRAFACTGFIDVRYKYTLTIHVDTTYLLSKTFYTVINTVKTSSFFYNSFFFSYVCNCLSILFSVGDGICL